MLGISQAHCSWIILSIQVLLDLRVVAVAALWTCIPRDIPFAPPSQLPKMLSSPLETSCPIIHPVWLARSHPSASQRLGDTSILGIPA